VVAVAIKERRWLVWKAYRSLLSIAYTAETGDGRGLILTQNFLTVAVK